MNVYVPKPMEFKGSCSAQDMDNFRFWVEECFVVIVIKNNVAKIQTAAMYLTDNTML